MHSRFTSSVARRQLRRTADVLGKLWASPATLVGLAVGVPGLLVALLLGRRPRVGVGFNALTFTQSPFVGTAIALGNVVVYGRNAACQPDSVCRPSGRCLAYEEMQHTIQAQWLGPLYLPAHLVFGVAALVADGRWHGRTNRLEVGPHAREPHPWSGAAARSAES